MSPAKVESTKSARFHRPDRRRREQGRGRERPPSLSRRLGRRFCAHRHRSDRVELARHRATHYEKLFQASSAPTRQSRSPLASREDANEGWSGSITSTRRPACSSRAATSFACRPSTAEPRSRKAIRRVNARGVAVGGTSAGAAILSEHMIAFGAEGNTPQRGRGHAWSRASDSPTAS